MAFCSILLILLLQSLFVQVGAQEDSQSLDDFNFRLMVAYDGETVQDEQVELFEASDAQIFINESSYGEYADALVNCTDILPKEQVEAGYENCSEVIDSLETFENLGLFFSLCESEAVWRWGYCQKTCGLCQDCEDNPYPEVGLECSIVKDVGLCREMEIYQDAVYCARSCETCEILAQKQGGSGCNNAKSILCDVDALQYFKSTMAEEAQNQLYSWVGNDPCNSNWKGITCNQQKLRVTEIQLGDVIRTQPLCTCNPQQQNCDQENCRQYIIDSDEQLNNIFVFSEANETKMNADMFTSIPPQISQMMYLEILDLSGNEIFGTLPPELSLLTNMQHLVLYDNKINGTIPPQYSSLSAMNQELHLGVNELSGEIPAEFSTLTGLQGLYLSDNFLSGSVPSELSSLGSGLLKVLSIQPQYDDNLCISTTTSLFFQSNLNPQTDVSQLAPCT